MAKNRYRAVWISDLHLGSENSHSADVIDFLKALDTEYLYLNGDIIDLWRVKKVGVRKGKTAKSDLELTHKILKMAKNGTKCHYIIGNHDEFLESFLVDNQYIQLANASVSKIVLHRGIKKNILTFHGHQFDMIVSRAPFLAKLGDTGYHITIRINRWFNRLTRLFRIPYFSLSLYAKNKVKKLASFMEMFAEQADRYARSTIHDYDGVCCGHIHDPEVKVLDSGILYLNSGCWTDKANRTAIVETLEGDYQLVQWTGSKIKIMETHDASQTPRQQITEPFDEGTSSGQS